VPSISFSAHFAMIFAAPIRNFSSRVSRSISPPWPARQISPATLPQARDPSGDPLDARSRHHPLWGARHPGQLQPVGEVTGWELDASAKAEIDRILKATISDAGAQRRGGISEPTSRTIDGRASASCFHMPFTSDDVARKTVSVIP
jgi:hypothetical protein